MKRILTFSLAVSLAILVPATPFADQDMGSLSGRAASDANQPYADYVVQLRDPSTGEVTSKSRLDAMGLFTFAGVPLSRRLLVELLHVPTNKVVCTKGPYMLTLNASARSDITINCGANRVVGGR